MSSTNKTVTIELSQYVGTDKPTYLSDYNGDMLKIDTAIAADRDSIATAQNTADGADAKADTNATAIADLNTEINAQDVGLAARVTGVEGNVNTINSLIGNGTPTTTDKTIIGAINEINAKVGSGSIEQKTLGIAATSVEFDVPTLGDHLIEFFIDDGSCYLDLDTSISGKATLTYEAAAVARTVVCKIQEVQYE